MSEPIKVAVIGYGHLGRWHCQKAEAFPHATLTYIVESNPEAAARAKEAHPKAEVVADIKMVVDKIDAAVIVTPTSTHHELLLYLVDNNKHVFCEKPVTSTAEQGEEVKKVLGSKKLIVQVGHSERFHKAWELRGKFSNFFNVPGTIKINRLAPFKGRATDVDVVQDLMIHDIDLLLFMFQEMPTRIHSTGYKIRTDKWDYVCSEFFFQSGRRALITVGRNHTEEVRELEVTNEFGSLKVDLFRNKILHAPKDKTENGEFVSSEDYEKRDHLLLEHEHFYNSIKKQSNPIISLDDGLKAVRLVDKVLESLEKNQEIQL